MARLYSYILRLDTGFAPNPFHGFCTLATCKPKIRKTARVGDYVIGTGSKSNNRHGVYAMRITEALTLDEYWRDTRFQAKKPQQTGCWKSACGDNVYSWNSLTNEWIQDEDSYHCEYDPSHDTRTDRVLVSEDFIYWGGCGPPIPPEFGGVDVLCTTQGHKCRFPEQTVRAFVRWFEKLDEKGILGGPHDKHLPALARRKRQCRAFEVPT